MNMSQVIEQPVDFKGMSADIIETSTGKMIKQASAIRWVWQPFKDIKLWDNLGAAFMNSLTLAPQPVQVLRRCQPYPLVNCEYEVSRHEARRYDHLSNEIPENDLSDNYSGATPTNPKTAHVVESKFAYTSARELSEMYAKEYGLVVIEPLTGIEDANVVRQVFDMVQPVTYRLSTLEKELTEGAEGRIKRSTHPREVKVLAEKCLPLMRKGCAKAIDTARQHQGDFSMNIQNASAGRKGRTTAWPHDIFIAEQLGVEIPQVVQTERKAGASTNDELLTRLAERELARGDENESLLTALEESEKRVSELAERLAKLEQVA
jgi:hypothetical protein